MAKEEISLVKPGNFRSDALSDWMTGWSEAVDLSDLTSNRPRFGGSGDGGILLLQGNASNPSPRLHKALTETLTEAAAKAQPR